MSETVLQLKQSVVQMNAWPKPVKFILASLVILLIAALIIIIALGANVCSSQSRSAAAPATTISAGSATIGPGCSGKGTILRGPTAGVCYLVQNNDARINWVEAQEFCRMRGGNLMTIHSVDEGDFLIKTLNDLNLQDVYLGFYASANRSQWIWTDDHKPVDFSVVGWAPGQPDKWNQMEYCGSTFTHYNGKRMGIAGRNIINDFACEVQQNEHNMTVVCKIPG